MKQLISRRYHELCVIVLILAWYVELTDDPAYDRRFQMSAMNRDELVKAGRNVIADAGKKAANAA